MRYGLRLGCRFGQPHDLTILHENTVTKWEVCIRCSKRFRWGKGYRGRVDNVAYLTAHVRNYAQPHGATQRVYQKIYQPETCVIVL